MALIDKLTGLFQSGAAKVVDSIGDALDKNITNKEEKEAAKLAVIQELNRHTEVTQDGIIEAVKSEDVAVTDRWKSDMESDNKLSKNTRPITMLSLLAFVFIIIVTDSINGINFNVKDGYVELLSTLLLTVVVAYFGSRGVEKWKSMHESKK